jgi:hypothetical protein
MARLIHQYAYPTYRYATRIDAGQLAFQALQIAVLTGIGVFLALAVLNTILGAPADQPASRPYE